MTGVNTVGEREMPRNRARTAFLCQQCGTESPKWLGRCPDCGEWGSLVEVRREAPSGRSQGMVPSAAPQELASLVPPIEERIPLPFPETHQVLGGGIVKGSLVLMAGDPGIGKSTLLLQIAGALATQGQRVLYVSGEESAHQVQLRARRLGIAGQGLYFLSETNAQTILGHLDALSPRPGHHRLHSDYVTEEAVSTAGSIAQVRECTRLLLQWAKARDVPVLIAGHVTKDGTVAGPRVLEHMVDVVLYLEGDPFSTYRILRSVKNRFGPTNDIALFQMTEQGLEEVQDPSAAFISQRQQGSIGSAVVVTMEGSRPLLAEVQALTTPSVFNPPRRTGNGVDFNRLILVAAVLSKRIGLPLATQDIIVNVAGGLRISEPSVDLGMALAIASSLRDLPLDPTCVLLGEIGLTGELRAVSQSERRLSEAAKLGFRRAILPAPQGAAGIPSAALEVVAVSTLREALGRALQHRRPPVAHAIVSWSAAPE